LGFVVVAAAAVVVFAVFVQNLGTTAKQVAMVWACAVKRRQ